MKKFDELAEEQKAAAVAYHVNDLLKAIIEEGIRFNDKLNGDDLQARIDKAFDKAESMKTPWFAHEYIMDTCRDDLEGMAQCRAEDCLYAETGDPEVIRGIA
jgi:hypothetical protein